MELSFIFEKGEKMAKRKLPPNWYDVYPQGCKQGDEEQAFFIALIRNPKWTFRSTAQLAKECNLTKDRIEQLIEKYYKKGMVFQNPANEDQWGYWERNPQLLPKQEDDLVDADHKDRMS